MAPKNSAGATAATVGKNAVGDGLQLVFDAFLALAHKDCANDNKRTPRVVR